MSTKEKRPAAKGAAKRTRRNTELRRSRAVAQSRRSQSTRQPTRRPQRRQPTPKQVSVRRAESQVVYTPPKTFHKLRFLLGVLSVAAIVLALTLGMSIFFKVENINVSGTVKYSAWDISEASGIQQGDNLLTLGKARVGGKIIAQLPYVDQVRIGIKLPDTVNIEITESDVIYTIQADDNSWWIMNSQGRVLEATTAFIAEHFTMIEGVRIAVPLEGNQAVASDAVIQETTAEETQATEAEGETAAPTAPIDTVSGADRLNMALAVVQNLERNGIVGEVTSVNVADIYNLELNYEDRYLVLLGEGTQLDHKIRAMCSAVAQMTDYQRGTLDVSFTIWANEVGYTPAAD